MRQTLSKENSWFSQQGLILLAVSAAIFCASLSILYSLGVLSLELVIIIAVLPFLPWLFLARQEVILLALVAAYFGAGYFSSTLVTEGLARGLFLLIIALVLLLKLGAKKVITRISTPLDKIIVIWSIIILFSFIYGFFFKHNDARYLIGDLYKFVEIFLVFWLTTLIVKNDRKIRFIIWGFLMLALILGAVDSMIFFKRFYLVGSVLLARVRAAAQFSSVFALVLAISLILHERRIVIRAILGILGLGFLISFLLSFLRTGYVAIPPALVFILLLYFYKNRGHLFAGIMRFVVLMLFLLIVVVSINLIFNIIGPDIDIIKASLVRLHSLIEPGSDDPMGVRMLELESITSKVLVPSPLLGNGLGGEYYSVTLVEGELEWGIKHYVHNNYFDFIVRTGILGLIVFLVLAIKYLKDAVRFYLRSKDRFYQGALLGSIGIFVCSCIIALSTSILYSPFLFMMMAITYGIASMEEKKGKEVGKHSDDEIGTIED